MISYFSCPHTKWICLPASPLERFGDSPNLPISLFTSRGGTSTYRLSFFIPPQKTHTHAVHPFPRNLKPSTVQHGGFGPGIRYRHDDIVITNAGSRAYNKKETLHAQDGGKKGVCGRKKSVSECIHTQKLPLHYLDNGIVSTWSSPPYH